MLCEISQIEKDKYCMVSLTCRILKIKNIFKKDQTHRNRESKNGCQGLGPQWGRNREKLVKLYKLLVTR